VKIGGEKEKERELEEREGQRGKEEKKRDSPNRQKCEN